MAFIDCVLADTKHSNNANSSYAVTPSSLANFFVRVVKNSILSLHWQANVRRQYLLRYYLLQEKKKAKAQTIMFSCTCVIERESRSASWWRWMADMLESTSSCSAFIRLQQPVITNQNYVAHQYWVHNSLIVWSRFTFAAHSRSFLW